MQVHSPYTVATPISPPAAYFPVAGSPLSLSETLERLTLVQQSCTMSTQVSHIASVIRPNVAIRYISLTFIILLLLYSLPSTWTHHQALVPTGQTKLSEPTTTSFDEYIPSPSIIERKPRAPASATKPQAPATTSRHQPTHSLPSSHPALAKSAPFITTKHRSPQKHTSVHSSLTKNTMNAMATNTSCSDVGLSKAHGRNTHISSISWCKN